MSGAAGALARTWRGLRWYLRAVSGETRWDEYLARCAEHGHAPASRREFERARADARAANPASRCC